MFFIAMPYIQQELSQNIAIMSNDVSSSQKNKQAKIKSTEQKYLPICHPEMKLTSDILYSD